VVKLNGWKRIGIIASIVWILGAGVHTYDSEIDSASAYITPIHVACDSYLAEQTGDTRKNWLSECDKEANDYLKVAYRNAWFAAALFAFIPVPLGWGFTYLVLFLVRWVKRGFVRPL